MPLKALKLLLTLMVGGYRMLVAFLIGDNEIGVLTGDEFWIWLGPNVSR